MGNDERKFVPLETPETRQRLEELKKSKKPLPPDISAETVGSGEALPENSQDNGGEKLLEKIEIEFSKFFDRQRLEQLIISSYSSRATQSKLQINLEEIRRSFLEMVRATPGSFSNLDGEGLERVIKQHVKKENDELNSNHKILHSEIEKICEKIAEPENGIKSAEKSGNNLTSREFQNKYGNIFKKNIYSPDSKLISVLSYSKEDGKALVGFEDEADRKKRETRPVSLEELDDLLKIYTIDKKKNEIFLTREKTKTDILGQAKLKRINGINIASKKADELLEKNDFTIDFGFFTAQKGFYKNFSKDNLAELEQYIHLANEAIKAALEKKKQERAEYLKRKKETRRPREKSVVLKTAEAGENVPEESGEMIDKERLPSEAGTDEPSPEEILDEEILPLEGEASRPEKMETGASQEKIVGPGLEMPLAAAAVAISAETEEQLQKMRGGIEQMRSELEQLKMEMEEAERSYLAKKAENQDHWKTFLSIFKKETDLGESINEERGLKEKYEVKKILYGEKLAELKSLEKELREILPEDGKAESEDGEEKKGEPEESEEKIIAETEKEIEALPEKERLKMSQILGSLGFYLEEAKNKFFAGAIESAAKDLPDSGKHMAERGSFSRFLTSLGENFREDAKKARANIDKVKKGESKKAASVFYLSGNILKYGRTASDFTKWAITSPLRYWMMGAMAFARGTDSIKEARLSSEKAIDKTRIKDIDEAAEIAWKIYHEAKAKKETVSEEDLKKAYEQNIPKDLLRRLNKDPKEIPHTGIMQGIIRYDVRQLTQRINGKIELIDQNEYLSKEVKQAEKDKIFEKYSDYLKSFDRLVAQCGTVDALAMGMQYAKTASKTAMYVVAAETLAHLAQKVSEISPNDLEKLSEDITKNVKERIADIEKLVNQESEIPQSSVTIHRGDPGFPGAFEQAAKTIDFNEIKGGGNIQASIRDHFKANPALIEKYNELYGGGRKFNAGQIAERLWDEYDDKRDLVHAGAQVHLSADGLHIEGVTGDENMGYLPEKEVPIDISQETTPETNLETIPEQSTPEADSVPTPSAESGEAPVDNTPDFEVPSGGTGEYLMDTETVSGIDKLEIGIKDLTNQLEELDDKILKVSSGQYESVQIWPNPERMLEDLTAQKQALEAAREELTTKIYSGYVGSLRKFFSGGDIEKWKGIEKMKAWDLLERRESIAHKFFDRVLDSDAKSAAGLKEQISPEQGETVKDWTLRVGKVMRKLGITKFK